MLYTKLKPKIESIRELTELGIIGSNWIRDIEVFEKYWIYTNNKSANTTQKDVFVWVGEDFNLSWESVKKIYEKLSK